MPKIYDTALNELEGRWSTMFDALVAGGEVPPTQRLRTEGFMEATVLLGHASEAQIQNAMAACYQRCFEKALPEEWQALFPFPQVPGFGRRAPVVPTTSD